MTVWYYSKWNEIYVRGSSTMWTCVDGVTCTILISDIKSWNNFTFLGEL
jgi:hypothetical protein